MGGDTIYFAVGFKSFDNTRKVSRAETWYDWVERGRNMMIRASFSQKTMEWIVHTLKEASKTQGNFVRRWKFHDHCSESFCSRNFNKFGRYFSIITMLGKRKAVIIIPEWAFNTGWLDIASKITNFINVTTKRTTNLLHRKTEEGLLYADTIKSNKWSTREMNAARVHREGRSLIISEDAVKDQNELLDRSLVGSLSEDISEVYLSEIRRWANNSWKQQHGINIYEMGGHNQFLFEFPSKVAADHIMKGEWIWKSHKFYFDWWLPTSNSVAESSNKVWIRLVGLPLQFWSQKILREIGEFCGGWIQTEEETELRNHLKWARLKVRGDEESVPKVVELVHGEISYRIQVWVEAPVRTLTSRQREDKSFVQRSVEKPDFIEGRKGLGYTEVMGHVGTSKSREILNVTAGQKEAYPCEGDVGLGACVKAGVGDPNVKRKEILGWGIPGFDPMAQPGVDGK
ncbi:hypothetical protein FXO37_35135 [Capsicum annuum]|nr:hypothetical protein FXO37_35135 [Capsicum annuum]